MVGPRCESSLAVAPAVDLEVVVDDSREGKMVI